MNKIYCIRHGWCAHNDGYYEVGMKAFEDKKYIKSQLTEKGIIQAQRLGEVWTEKDNIDIILTSPLERCIDTANLIFGNQSKLYVLDCLREYPAGLHYCNYRSSKSELLHKYNNIHYIDVPDENEDSYFKHNRLETKDEALLRINNLKNFLHKYKNKNIAIIGHCSLFSLLLNKDLHTIKHCYPYTYTFLKKL